MKKAYIARETIAPAFPEDVDGVIDLMREDLEQQGFQVVVGEHCLAHQPWRQEEYVSSEIVEAAWQRACDRYQSYLMGL